MADISIGTTLLISLVGICVVFAVLVIIMAMIWVMSKVLKLKKAKAPAAEAAVAAPVTEQAPELAPGSCGEVKTFGVPDRTAAMLMAIVADKLGKPLNELRFVSIREVEDTEK